MEKIRDNLKQFFLDFANGYGLNIARTLAIFVLGLLIVRILSATVRKNAVKSRRLDNAASSFIASLIALVAYVALALAVISSLGFSTAGIVAAFSSVMLAVALGMQDALSSLTNGILLIFTRPFRAGDYVDIGGTAGTVKEIRLFSVKVTTPDNLTVIIPNSTVLGAVITNYSRMSLRRIDIVVPVAYGTDVEKLKGLVTDFVKRDSRVAAMPAPVFRLTEYGDSALNFSLRAWTEPEIFWSVKFDLLEGVLSLLEANGYGIPYSRLDVRVTGERGA